MTAARGAQLGTEAGMRDAIEEMIARGNHGTIGWLVGDMLVKVIRPYVALREAEARQQGRETLDVMAVLDRELDRQRELARRGGGEPIDWLFANGFATAVEVARAALAADPRPECPICGRTGIHHHDERVWAPDHRPLHSDPEMQARCDGKCARDECVCLAPDE